MAGLKVKEDDPALAGLTTDIQLVFRGLKFESDAKIGQKRVFFKGLIKASYIPAPLLLPGMSMLYFRTGLLYHKFCSADNWMDLA